MSILDPPCAVAHGGKYAHFHPRSKHGNSKYRNSKSDILQKSINRGVAQLIERRIWEHRRSSHRTKAKIAESPSTVRISGGSEKEKSSQKCV